MNHIVDGYAAPGGTDLRIFNKIVLADCRANDTSSLLYVRFKSWSQLSGFLEKNTFNGGDRALRRSMDIMFRHRTSYELELWFIAPSKATDFRWNCLRYFTKCLLAKVRSSDHFQDLNGVYFNRTMMLKPRVWMVNRVQQTPYHASANTNRPKFKQAEQSTAEPELNPASQSAENSTVMKAQDAKMSDPSISVLPKTHPIPEMRALLTFGAGPLSPPTQDLRTNVSDFSFGFDIPTSVPACISAWPSTFAPIFMVADIDNNSKSESDSGNESNGDMERQHDGQGKGDCRTA